MKLLIPYNHFTSTDWTTEWPTEPGYYWFYGWPTWHRDLDAELYFVEITQGQYGGLDCAANGQIMYADARGLWHESSVPVPTMKLWQWLLHTLEEET